MDLYTFNEDNRDWHKEIFKLYAGFRKNPKEAKKKRNDR